MNHFGFLQFTVYLCFFPAQFALLSSDAKFEVEKPRYACFFTDLLRLGRAEIFVVAHRHDTSRLGSDKSNGPMLGAAST